MRQQTPRLPSAAAELPHPCPNDRYRGGILCSAATFEIGCGFGSSLVIMSVGELIELIGLRTISAQLCMAIPPQG